MHEKKYQVIVIYTIETSFKNIIFREKVTKPHFYKKIIPEPNPIPNPNQDPNPNPNPNPKP